MFAVTDVCKREEVAGEGQPVTMKRVKPTDTVKLSATPCQLDLNKRMAQLIGKHCTVSYNINGVPVEMLLDSGDQ
ncbi:hypothetical protein M9458_037668, partial [Cirrhinus mrigala]